MFQHISKHILFCLISAAPWCFAESYELKATPTTVVWGYYSAAAPPVLRIHSGDRVRIETVSTGSPARFEASGVAPGDIPANFRQIYQEVKDKVPAATY
jgi:hypothetical protein